MGNPIIHWEFVVPDAEKARTFYRKIFGWRFDDKAFPGYTIIDTGSPPGGGMMEQRGGAPMAGLNTYFEVSDLQHTLHDVLELGGKVLVKPTEIPTVGAYAMFADPSGIAVGVLQPVKR
ncbi:MAG: VOC family protein [Archangium sp.]|nr:VOC family protein [Archangium sp.]